MKWNPFLFLALLLVLSSCQEGTSEQGKEIYCPNEIRIFAFDDQIKLIGINYNEPKEKILDFVEQKFEEDLCWKKVYFGLKLKSGNMIKVSLLKECKDDVIRNFGLRPGVKILLNQRGKLMIENEVIPIDSVKFWISAHYPNDDENDLQEIAIDWSIETPADSIEKALVNIEAGYFLVYQSLSKKKFEKGFCDLNNEELIDLRKELPFEIKLDLANRTIPPPPPPNEQALDKIQRKMK